MRGDLLIILLLFCFSEEIILFQWRLLIHFYEVETIGRPIDLSFDRKTQLFWPSSTILWLQHLRSEICCFSLYNRKLNIFGFGQRESNFVFILMCQPIKNTSKLNKQIILFWICLWKKDIIMSVLYVKMTITNKYVLKRPNYYLFFFRINVFEGNHLKK